MSLEIGFLVFPKVQQLDLTGPYEVLAMLPDAKLHLVWKDRDPVASSTGLVLAPTTPFAECPRLDVLCVPGGRGVNPLLTDAETLDFVRSQARTARYVTSVCTGALVLGAAGLLTGKRATTHWAAHDLLSAFGAEPVRGRVVRDGTLITGGGVTAGIDFGLALAAELAGEQAAKAIQLSLEYAPDPPFASGDPETAEPDVLSAARENLAASRREREAIIARITTEPSSAVGPTDDRRA